FCQRYSPGSQTDPPQRIKVGRSSLMAPTTSRRQPFKLSAGMAESWSPQTRPVPSPRNSKTARSVSPTDFNGTVNRVHGDDDDGSGALASVIQPPLGKSVFNLTVARHRSA